MIKLNLWDIKNLYSKELYHQVALALFFGAMGVLFIYNLFIYFSTRDISYLWYVLYIFFMTFHHTLYMGIAHIYLLNETMIKFSLNTAYLWVLMPSYFLTLFTKYFLNTKNYPKIDKYLIFYLSITPIILLLGLFDNTNSINEILVLFIVLNLWILFLIACYGSYKKNRQAYFIVFGWLILFLSWILMFISGIGVFDIYQYFPYLVETGILSEAIVFSFALADRIKTLQKEKQKANELLLLQQKNEEKKLQTEVENKTHHLTQALEENQTLLKELHHRVKNNMQMVVSLLRLQSYEIVDERLKSTFKQAQNRISAMGHLHELLYKQESLTHINSLEYFTLLINEISSTCTRDIEITYDIKCDLKMQDAIYCGLILNELISNSFKYAFKDTKTPKIEIELFSDKNIYTFIVKDNGIGFDMDINAETLGLSLIKGLVKKQLKGKIELETKNGTIALITWREK